MAPHYRIGRFLAMFVSTILVVAEEQKTWEEQPPLLSVLADLDYRDYLPDAASSPQAANQLSDLGFQAYQGNRLIDAARLFKAALEMDGRHAYAH
jgi:hypothetical protein